MRRRLARWLLFCLAFGLLAVCFACAPAAAPTQAPAQQSTPVPAAGPAEEKPAARATSTPSELAPTAAASLESRSIELEWPAQLRMGESDVIRLALVPTRDGYVARAEFPEHDLQTQEVVVPRPNGYVLYAIARLDGVGFEIAPAGDQVRFVPEAEEIAWRWTLSPRAPGQQRLSVQLRLRWEPAAGVVGSAHESLAYGRGIDVQVRSFLGLSRSQAASSGLIGMFLGCGCLLAAFAGRGRADIRRGMAAPGIQQVSSPAHGPEIDARRGMDFSVEEKGLFRSLFNQAARLVLENEFLSGYSGARTFLVRPIRPDGGADALTIVKIGPLEAIRQEFANYESFVKDRLPPVTARIQRPPVALSSSRCSVPVTRAAMQYTFIAEPGRSPVSLGNALRENPNPALLQQLFETFGPSWWMQRRSAVFRVEQEYDRLLPPHYVLKPVQDNRKQTAQPALREDGNPADVHLTVGDIVLVKPFQQAELRADGSSISMIGISVSGKPALRLRWLDNRLPDKNTLAQVTATRMGLLQECTDQCELFGLPDPLTRLPVLLEETVSGTRSVIHGDLNLENVLVGPGSLVWLIDFALTREGHPLYDFAHLESELIAHILAERVGSPRAYLDLWRSGEDPLLNTLHSIAGRCLLDPMRPREYHLALFMACMGALKYQNITPLARHCLYLTAADLADRSLK